MVLVVGVKFDKSGKIYYFDPNGIELKRGDNVIVETSLGLEFANVVASPKEIDETSIKLNIKPIIRKADEKDLISYKEQCLITDVALKECKRLVIEMGLDMKIVKAVYTFDRNKLLFYFISQERVDFRELVKILANNYKTRIELRQIGSRDATKKIGGIGSCGRPLCCSSFLNEFKPVSIKMLKEQNISFNPSQISGHCSRLMCCLAYENEAYKKMNKEAPNIGETVTIKANNKKAKVIKVDLLKQEVKVLIEEDEDSELYSYNYEDIKYGKN